VLHVHVLEHTQHVEQVVSKLLELILVEVVRYGQAYSDNARESAIVHRQHEDVLRGEHRRLHCRQSRRASVLAYLHAHVDKRDDHRYATYETSYVAERFEQCFPAS